MNRLQTSSVVGGLLMGAWAAGLSPAWAATQLECQVTYAGTTETIIAQPTDNPYTVAATDIAGRFRFKPVLVAQANQLRYVSIYVYQQTRHQPTLIQQAKYLPPYPLPGPTGHIALTGEQRLYAGTMERELMYQCTLAEAKP
ncbi:MULTISPECIES: hypothetical protein [Giesbergeria]|uniref:Uncharacterized protein n=1 Tax=Giesbergeria sinuosa TaxID=80883 RepID=A0ABV9QFC3_9BURK